MRILVVTQYYYPEQFRVNDICKELSARGHSVTVLTGLPNYPEGEIYPGYEDSYSSETVLDGINVIRVKMRPRHKGTINLIRNYLSFVWAAFKRINEFKDCFDVVYVYEVSPITVAMPALSLKKKFKTPIYLYCCDLWPESVRGEHNGHKQISKKHPVFIAAKLISQYIYKRVNYIGCKCEEFIDYLEDECGVSRAKCSVLYEHAEESYLSISPQPVNNDVVDFMFLGNMGRAQNCDLIISAASKLTPSKPFKVHFVGDGSEIDALKEQVISLNMHDKVVFHGKYPVSELKQFYDLADACLLTLSNRTATGLTPPAKLSGYMAASRAVIGSINGAANTIVNDAHCGLIVPADDEVGLQKIMQLVLDGGVDLIEMGSNGRKYFLKHFTLKKHIDELEKSLQLLIS